MPERKTVLLVPGLFSPRWHMSGLRGALEKRGFDARVWDDASVFGAIEDSVDALGHRLGSLDRPAGVVTHSFGDWIFRQVAANGGADNIDSLVSLVPVMASSFFARLVKPLGQIAPEIAVMASEERSGEAIEIPVHIDRLVIWSRLDPWVRTVGCLRSTNTTTTTVAGTHNSILWQPAVQDIAIRHLSS